MGYVSDTLRGEGATGGGGCGTRNNEPRRVLPVNGAGRGRGAGVTTLPLMALISTEVTREEFIEEEHLIQHTLGLLSGIRGYRG